MRASRLFAWIANLGRTQPPSDSRTHSRRARIRSCVRCAARFRLRLRFCNSCDPQCAARQGTSHPNSSNPRLALSHAPVRRSTAATPNEPEVEAILGIRIGHNWDKLVAAGETLMTRMKLQSLLITRGKDGMVAFSRRHRPIDIPIVGSDEVADVTGAGDTVIATFTADSRRAQPLKRPRNSQITRVES